MRHVLDELNSLYKEFIDAAKAAGAIGLVSKTASAQELAAALLAATQDA
jgi:hypothetical protein